MSTFGGAMRWYRRVDWVLLVVVFFFNVQGSMAQSSRLRLPTQYNQSDDIAAPSFRGTGQGQGNRNFLGGRGAQMPNVSSSLAGSAANESALAVMGYQVHVLGEVVNPGTYRIAASDRLSEAIATAGGLNENGSERNIELRRKGGAVTQIDLLSFKLLGKLQDNPYLTDNDVIFVPLRNKVVQVLGAVKRSGVYELRNEKTLEDVLELSGSFNAAVAMKEPMRVIRFEGGEKKVEEIPIEKMAMAEFQILNGDVVVVPNVITEKTTFDYNVASIPGDQIFYPSYEDRVFVLGGVAYPGAYPFSPYYTINQYISLAGGLNDRGVAKYRIIAINGESKRSRAGEHVNPGSTIMVKERWMSPASWTGFALGLASFGLSASSTVLALSR